MNSPTENKSWQILANTSHMTLVCVINNRWWTWQSFIVFLCMAFGCLCVHACESCVCEHAFMSVCVTVRACMCGLCVCTCMCGMCVCACMCGMWTNTCVSVCECMHVCHYISARISKKVEGGDRHLNGILFSMFIPLLRGGTICRAVIVPGTTIGDGGGIPPIPPEIRAVLYIHVAVCVCMHVSVCTHACVCVCAHACSSHLTMHVFVWWACMCLCVRTCMCLCVHACMRLCVHACLCQCACTCMYFCVSVFLLPTSATENICGGTKSSLNAKY